MKTSKAALPRLALALALALLTAPAAHAGPLDAVVTYVTGNLVGAVSTLAVIGIGLFMLSMRVNWIAIVTVCAGIWIIANAATLSTTFANG